MRPTCRGFTLIELLIVVAIIAILALIAVPNFLEAQIRAKVARAVADMRSLATGIEAYYVDANDYPRNYESRRWTVSPDITTPVAFLSSGEMVDPFSLSVTESTGGGTGTPQFPYYSYHRVMRSRDLTPPEEYWPPVESRDGPLGQGNPGALEKYGQWRMLSLGPDRVYVPPDWRDIYLGGNPGLVFEMIETLYDPTNGSVSFGNIVRTQISADGVVRQVTP